MDESEWRAFLEAWSRDVLASPQASELPPEVVALGWLGYPGATEAAIAAAEARLGLTLPPSYRTFLKVTNGWRFVDEFVDGLWPVEDIAPFAARHQDWIDICLSGSGEETVSDADYFVYGRQQQPFLYRPEYLVSAVEISPEGDGDVCIYLLNPSVMTPDGEWEAWFLAAWNPGATRYRSFQEKMQAHYDRAIRRLRST